MTENPFAESAVPAYDREAEQARGRQLHKHSEDCTTFGCDLEEGKPNNQNWDPKDIDPTGPVDRARHTARRVAHRAADFIGRVTGRGKEEEAAPTSSLGGDEWDQIIARQKADDARVAAKRATPEYKAEEAKRQAGADFEEKHGVPASWRPGISRIAPEGRSQEVHDNLIKEGHRRETQGLISIGGRDYSASSYSIKHALSMFGDSEVSVHPHGAGERASHVLTNVRTEGDKLIGSVGSFSTSVPLSQISSIHFAGSNPNPPQRYTEEHEIWRQ